MLLSHMMHHTPTSYMSSKTTDALTVHVVSMRNADLPSDTSEWEKRAPLTIEQLHKYFRKIALSIHPDRNPHPRATETFQRLSNIKTFLLDAMQRN